LLQRLVQWSLNQKTETRLLSEGKASKTEAEGGGRVETLPSFLSTYHLDALSRYHLLEQIPSRTEDETYWGNLYKKDAPIALTPWVVWNKGQL
jgi:hypothetical protein